MVKLRKVTFSLHTLVPLESAEQLMLKDALPAPASSVFAWAL